MNVCCRTAPASVSSIKKVWLLIDAEGQFVGRLSSVVATILRGKDKVDYTPFLDMGDNVIIVNASKVVFSGDKLKKKEYVRHTGYPGGQRFIKAKALMEKNPCSILYKAIKGMLPKNRLGRKLLTNVRVFSGSEHDMQAQKPVKYELGTLR